MKKCDSSKSKTLEFLFLFQISIIISFPSPSYSGDVYSGERSALLEFKSSVSDPSGRLSNWIVANDSDSEDFEHCSWYGVACDSAHRVTSLSIAGSSCVDVSKKFPFYRFGIRRSCDEGRLRGNLSPAIANLKKIRVLELPWNELSGTIPSGVWELEELEALDLEGNSISGNLKSSFAGLRRLRVLNLGLNKISGMIPVLFSELVDLEVVNLAGNGLSGLIPGLLGGGSKLQGLYLSMNRLTGDIPSRLGSHCSDLEYLDLSGNLLKGSIPASLGKCRKLKVLLLFGNRLRGSIPSTLGQLRRLEVLDVSRNNIRGPVPEELGNCVEMSVLVLSNLYDPFPADRGLGGLSVMHSSFGGGEGNCFRGKFPMEIATLPKLRVLWAPKVALRGEIPRTWLACDCLEMINLSMNQFTGEIKETFKSCRSLVYVDLSSNQLHGELNGNIMHPCMIVFNVHGNSISGAIPGSRKTICHPMPSWVSGADLPPGPASTYLFFFASKARFRVPLFDEKRVLLRNFHGDFPARSLQSNSEDLNYDVTPPSDGNGRDKFNSIEIASIVCATVIILVFLALVILFICTRKCLPEDSSRVEVLEHRQITTFMDIGVPLTFEKIIEATENFSACNCIGSGGFGTTYKAEVSPGITVAVKRLSVGRFHCVQQFHAEIQTLGKIRHENLVTLVGYHASEAEMFLIYNYLPRGNLEGFIQERGKRKVNWRIVHKIALDIASALAYLHDECDPRVIHRDVKPSNILLDNDLNAYLSDFGLSRLLGPTETHATTGVAGTFGYLAPEYALTCRVSDKCDVYSYGVVLLELISDKKALDPSFSSHGNGYNIVPWACMLLRQGRSKEVFSARIWDEGPQDDLVEVLYLAVKCTVDTLSIRPTMKQVVQRLRRLRPPC